MYAVSEYIATLRAAAFVGLLLAKNFLLRDNRQLKNIRGFFLGRKRFSFWGLFFFDNQRLFAVWVHLQTNLRLRDLLNRKIRIFLPLNISSFNTRTFFHGLCGCDDLYLFSCCNPVQCILLQNYLIVAFRFLIKKIDSSVCVEVNRFMSCLLQAPRHSNEFPDFCSDLRVDNFYA